MQNRRKKVRVPCALFHQARECNSFDTKKAFKKLSCRVVDHQDFWNTKFGVNFHQAASQACEDLTFRILILADVWHIHPKMWDSSKCRKTFFYFWPKLLLKGFDLNLRKRCDNCQWPYAWIAAKNNCIRVMGTQNVFSIDKLPPLTIWISNFFMDGLL